MINPNAIKGHRLFVGLLSIAVLAVGMFLIVGALGIYFEGGDQPYSREAVAATLGALKPLLFAFIALVIITFVWEWISPLPVAKQRVIPDRQATLSRLATKKDVSAANTAIQEAILREQTKRRVHVIIRAALILVCGTVFAAYALSGDHYTADINTSMIRAMTVLIPCAVIPFGYGVFAAYAIDKSYQREIALFKALPSVTSTSTEAASHSVDPAAAIRIILLFAAVALLVYGFMAGGTADVLTKAVNICTECIGLG